MLAAGERNCRNYVEHEGAIGADGFALCVAGVSSLESAEKGENLLRTRVATLPLHPAGLVAGSLAHQLQFWAPAQPVK